MNIGVEQLQDPVPVTVLRLEGELDASSYLDVIEQAQSLFSQGTRNLLLDLSDLTFMSSSGLVAMHSMALIMRGEAPPDPEYGWNAIHAIERDVSGGSHEEPHFKLLNPQERVRKTLKISGLDTILSIHSDRDTAVASFAGAG